MESDPQERPLEPRVASIADAAVIARLLHDFNVEFAEPSPGASVLARRLSILLSSANTVCVLAGDPPAGFALLTLRPNVWYDAPVALLDELYVVPTRRGQGIGSALLDSCWSLVRARDVELLEVNVDGEDRDARRFYERHGFSRATGEDVEPDLYYSRHLP